MGGHQLLMIVFINANCNVAPVFDNTMFAVTISSTGPGTVTPIGLRAILFGSHVTSPRVPDPGLSRQRADHLRRRQQPPSAANQFTTASPVTADCSITVSFTAITPQFTITPIAGRAWPFRRPRRSRLHRADVPS